MKHMMKDMPNFKMEKHMGKADMMMKMGRAKKKAMNKEKGKKRKGY